MCNIKFLGMIPDGTRLKWDEGAEKAAAAKEEPACPECKRPPHSSRMKRGERVLICGNGHDWLEKPPEQSEQAHAADRAEGSKELVIIIKASDIDRSIRDTLRKHYTSNEDFIRGKDLEQKSSLQGVDDYGRATLCDDPHCPACTFSRLAQELGVGSLLDVEYQQQLCDRAQEKVNSFCPQCGSPACGDYPGRSPGWWLACPDGHEWNALEAVHG